MEEFHISSSSPVPLSSSLGLNAQCGRSPHAGNLMSARLLYDTLWSWVSRANESRKGRCDISREVGAGKGWVERDVLKDTKKKRIQNLEGISYNVLQHCRMTVVNNNKLYSFK